MKSSKHNHNLTNYLKVGIFGLIILMPFLIWLPTGLYFGFNEHANQTADITTAMITGWTTIWSNNMFSWITTTSMYTVFSNMTTTIEISTNSCIANYLTYLTFMTIIYVIVDIVLGAFTILTHMFNKDIK